MRRPGITPGESFVDLAGDRGIGRPHLRGPGAGQLAVGSDQVFAEIPARRAGLAESRGDPAVERVGGGADDPDLLGQREVDLVVGLAELFYLGGAAGLLLAEIVRGHAEHDEAAVAVALPQRLEIAVLRRVAAKRGDVDHQHRTAAPFGQRQLVAVERDEFELIGVAGVAVARHLARSRKPFASAADCVASPVMTIGSAALARCARLGQRLSLLRGGRGAACSNSGLPPFGRRATILSHKAASPAPPRPESSGGFPDAQRPPLRCPCRPVFVGQDELLEALLFASGSTSRRGSVRDGNSVGDHVPEARARQMSTEINVANATFLDDPWTILDCPGSVELLYEAQQAMLVADIVVVVCEPEVDRAITVSALLRFLARHDIPHMLFINKLDAANARVRDVLAALQSVSDRPLVLRQVPLTTETGISGYVDLVSERAYRYRPGQASDLIPLPDGFWDEEGDTRTSLVEKLADFDDALLEQLLEDVQPSKEDIYKHLTQDLQKNLIVPVFVGAAAQDYGVRRLWKALRHEAPGPAETAARLGIEPTGEPLAQVFKTYHLPHTGKLSLARVWRGSVSEGNVLNGTRVAGVVRLVGAQHEKVPAGQMGEVVGLTRMEDVQTGAVLTPSGKAAPLPQPEKPQPVYGLAIHAEKRGDDVKLTGSIAKLIEEDPTLELEQNAELREMVLWGQGDVHLQIALDRMRHRQNLTVVGHHAAVPYKETIRRGTQQHSRFKRQSGGHGQFADCTIEVEAAAARLRLHLYRQGGRRRDPAQLHPGRRGRRCRGIGSRAARLSGRRPRGRPADRPVPCRRQLGHGVQDRRPAGDPGSAAEMRADPAGADRRGRNLGAERLHRAGAAADLRPARPDPRLRRQGGLAGLGRRQGAPAAQRIARPDRRIALADPRGRQLRPQVRPHGGADRPAGREGDPEPRPGSRAVGAPRTHPAPSIVRSAATK